MNIRACAWGVVFASTCAFAQNAVKDAATAQQVKAVLDAAATAGVPLNTASNVSDSLNIEAVMLPSGIVKRVFGNEVANNYAVIEVNIGNRNTASAFILHSLYIDYGDWALAQGYDLGGPTQNPPPYTSRTKSTQVSSVEYRIVRGEVMDRQPYTWRNITVNTMKGLGTVATAFAFPFSGDVARGISAWNGAVVPALENYWPDNTQGQLNRISDYGFRNNKVVPQESADIVVAFFPISRFLPKSLKEIFLQNPALFFSPLMLAIDPSQKEVQKILESALGDKEAVENARKSLLSALAKTDGSDFRVLTTEVELLEKSIAKDRIQVLLMPDIRTADQDATMSALKASMNSKEEKLQILTKDLATKFNEKGKGAELFRLLSALSLSKVSIVVSGTMNADEQNIPASIMQTCFDDPAPELWGEEGTKSCALHGRFLLNGTPKFTNSTPADIGIGDIAVKNDASSSDLLTFTYKLKEAIDPPKFDLIVTKTGKNNTSVDSMKYGIAGRSSNLPQFTVDDAKTDGDGTNTKYIITGTNFFSVNPNNVLSVSLKPSGAGSEIAVPNATRDSRTQITLPASDLQSATATKGCYAVVVKRSSITATNGTVNLKVEDSSDGTKKISKVDKCS